MKFLRKDRALGVSEKRRYDIPLDQGTSRYFLTLLIGLMVFLAMLSITAAYALAQFADRWQTGLEGRWTIELPGVDAQGRLIPRTQLKDQAMVIQTALADIDTIQETEVLADEELRNLLNPWFDLSEDASINELPLPVLISLSVTGPDIDTATEIEKLLTALNPQARLDRHQDWLDNLLRITGALRFIAFLFTGVICAAAVTAVGGAVQSRMAEHKDSVQLLHLMGASDIYIMKQFQRHGVVMALQGGVGGLALGAAVLLGITQVLSQTRTYQMPQIEFSALFWLMLIALPLFAACLAAVTTRWTVLHTLSRMP